MYSSKQVYSITRDFPVGLDWFSLLRGNPHMDPVGMVKELSPIADVEYEGEEDSYGGVCG